MRAAGAAILTTGDGGVQLEVFDVDTDDSDDIVVDKEGGSWSMGDGGNSTFAGSTLDPRAEGTSLERWRSTTRARGTSSESVVATADGDDGGGGEDNGDDDGVALRSLLSCPTGSVNGLSLSPES